MGGVGKDPAPGPRPHAAKLANVLLGIVLLPLWLFGQLIGGRIRHLLMSLERRGRRPLPVPPERERNMDGLMRDLQAIPEHLRHSNFAELRKGFADISNFVVAQHREGAVIGYRYPGQFKDHIVKGADGERIAASIALQEAARPGLIVVHGLFTSSRFDYVRQIAVRAYYEWGFNVAALDLRSFGMTELTSPAPSTGGWKEGLDILALGRYMKELGRLASGPSGSRSGVAPCSTRATTRRRRPRWTAGSSRSRRPRYRSSPGSGCRSRCRAGIPAIHPQGLRGGPDLAGPLGAMAPEAEDMLR